MLVSNIPIVAVATLATTGLAQADNQPLEARELRTNVLPLLRSVPKPSVVCPSSDGVGTYKCPADSICTANDTCFIPEHLRARSSAPPMSYSTTSAPLSTSTPSTTISIAISTPPSSTESPQPTQTPGTGAAASLGLSRESGLVLGLALMVAVFSTF
ncbi:hypothetical protein F5Y16DRAFT_117031 [Xylariaceae sp. FL0255]|nr:hypothetical protein F5Y16DRAFT_117031 [Xylariaceae sp. FL0255]